MNAQSRSQETRIAVGAIDSVVFVAPSVIFTVWTRVTPFMNDVGFDRSIAACIMLVGSLLLAFGIRRMLGLKD